MHLTARRALIAFDSAVRLTQALLTLLCANVGRSANLAQRCARTGDARNACKQLRGLGFPADLIRVGDVFQALQVQRHDAGYDPTHRVTRADALTAIAQAEDGIGKLNSTADRDRVAFAIQLTLWIPAADRRAVTEDC